MADTHVTITGNLTDNPELKFTPNGHAVANFRLAVTTRVKDGEGWKDGDTSFFRVNVWRQLAEHVTDSLSKGDRAVVVGRLKSRSWETPRATSARWSRSRPTRSPPPCVGPPPSPSGRPRTARPSRGASSTTSRRSKAPSSCEAGAAVTRPGLAHHEPLRRFPDAPLTLPHPIDARAGAASAGRHLDRQLPDLRVPARHRPDPAAL
jgi:single-stranded DNA-binding protein